MVAIVVAIVVVATLEIRDPNKPPELGCLAPPKGGGKNPPRSKVATRTRRGDACGRPGDPPLAPSDPELHGLRQYPDDPKVLAQPHWQGRFTPRDYEALTPLIWEHVNSYGRFELDMNVRLALL